jgi:hypothetical protein
MPFESQDLGMKPGEVVSRWNVTSVEMNQPPPAGIFDPPTLPLTPVQFPAGQNSVSINFDLTENAISLPVSINGLPPAQFLFDTGSTATIAASYAEAHGIKSDPAGVTFGGGTGESAAGMATISRIELGGLQMFHQDVSVNALPFDGINGLLGYELVRRTVVQIEFASHRITFSKPESFHKPANAVALPLRFASGSEPLIDATIDGKRGEFQIDTGQDSGLTLNRPFAERNGLFSKHRHGRKGAAVGIGGAEESIEFTPAKFVMGGLAPATGVADISLSRTGSGAEEHVAGAIGIGILKQFTVTLDYANRMAYFEKNADFGKQTLPPRISTQTITRSKSGWLGFTKLRCSESKPVEILSIDPDSPAAQAAIEPGDLITRINGQPIERLLKPYVKDGTVLGQYLDPTILSIPPGTEVTLTLQRKNRLWDVKLVAAQ